MSRDDYDYQSAGFDGFMSRSIDDLNQSNLDSAGPVSTQLAYDRSQVTGMLGDSYRMGDILFDGKEGRTTYHNNQDPFLIEGELFDGARGIRFQNAGGVGLAQFGIFGNGKLALKIAKDGFDAATATDDQLIFNSGQNIFKIVKKITDRSIPQFTTTYDGSTYTTGGALLTVPHGLTFTPKTEVFVQGQMVNFVTSALITSTYVPLPIYPGHASSLNLYIFPNSSGGSSYAGVSIIFGVDATNVYVQANLLLTGNVPDTIAAIPVSIFLLQETAV